MQEARYSFNVRCLIRGFDCQLTVRTDDNGQELLTRANALLDVLAKTGAQPKLNGNGAPEAAPNTPKCPQHDKAARGKGGNLFCPTRLPNGSWCKWRSENKTTPERRPADVGAKVRTNRGKAGAGANGA